MPNLRCETCGNGYDKPFQIVKNGKTYTFDSFECAIQALAPVCGNCGVRILGHGLETIGNRGRHPKRCQAAESLVPRVRLS